MRVIQCVTNLMRLDMGLRNILLSMYTRTLFYVSSEYITLKPILVEKADEQSYTTVVYLFCNLQGST